jgi:hypothetical protein
MHFKQHQKYPANFDQIMEECEQMSDFTEEDKKWLEDNLPKKTYNSYEEVMQALDMDAKAMPMQA